MSISELKNGSADGFTVAVTVLHKWETKMACNLHLFSYNFVSVSILLMCFHQTSGPALKE